MPGQGPRPRAPRPRPQGDAALRCRFARRVALVAVLTALILSPACLRRKQPPLPTLAGPEELELLADVTGTLLRDQPRGGITALHLPSLAETVLREPGAGGGPVHFLSGPDRDGRMVWVESSDWPARTRLMARQLPAGEERALFERRGDVLWKHVMGPPALAPMGGRVAFVWNAEPDYGALVEGPLELWRLETGAGGPSGVTALGEGLCWFPDGERLVFVERLPRGEALAISVLAPGMSSGPGDEPLLPVVSILDVSDGTTTRLCVGRRPLVNPAGDALLVQDLARDWWRLDLTRRAGLAVRWPGDWRGPIAWVSDDLLLYWGLPTEGAPVRHTRFGSPLVWRHAMGDLKLGVLGPFSQSSFQTVIQGIDPRTDLSFGPWPGPGRGPAERPAELERR